MRGDAETRGISTGYLCVWNRPINLSFNIWNQTGSHIWQPTPQPEMDIAKALKTKVMGEERFTKRNKNSGQFMAQKKDDSKFKGVRKEKPN
jgi:hypothetical protein